MAERLDPEVRRARIVATAMEVISDEGYRGLSMRGLAKRCGMSAPGLMHYFPDMPTLLMAVLERRDEIDGQAVDQAVRAHPGARALMDSIIDRMEANPKAAQLFAVLEAEAIDPSHPAHQYFLDRTQRVMRDIAGPLAGTFERPLEEARRLMAVLDGLQLSWLRDPQGFDLRTEWEALADRLILASPSTDL